MRFQKSYNLLFWASCVKRYLNLELDSFLGHSVCIHISCYYGYCEFEYNNIKQRSLSILDLVQGVIVQEFFVLGKGVVQEKNEPQEYQDLLAFLLFLYWMSNYNSLKIATVSKTSKNVI